MKDKKNTFTNIIAGLVVALTAANAYLETAQGEVNWLNLALGVGMALIAWFTGKSKNGKKK